jgi:TRAP-type uncharacterized transport system fused permease subunit
MEEQEKNWVEKFSKDELIEDIQHEFATDARNNIGCGGFLLILLVFNLFSAFKTGNWSTQAWPALAWLLLLFIYEIWWKKKMSKCEDAHQLVDMYDKYNKANKTLSYVAAFALVLYICYDLYSDLGKVSTTSILITVAVVGVILGVIVWSLFRKIDKKPIDKEMDRLRELNTKE